MQTMYQPAAESLSFRASLSSSISSVRRIRPAVPFWKLAVHRIPTLRLYRNLLRRVEDENLRFRIRTIFRENRHLTSPKTTRKRLEFAHKLLDRVVQAQADDEKANIVLARYSQMIWSKREQERWKKGIIEGFAWQEKLRNRPILTGSIVRATFFNKPFPRMRPQPSHISMIIRKRRQARARRVEKWKDLIDMREDLQFESMFEARLDAEALKDGIKLENVFRDKSWDSVIIEQQQTVQKSFDLDVQRSKSPVPPEMEAQVKEARREKFRNKAREAERERRGEVLARTLKRQRKGPPAAVLATMTEEQKMMDKISRSVSEVGYVAMVKQKLGFKLRDPTLWTREMGPPEDWERLEELEREIMKENLRRRTLAESEISDP